MALHDPVTWYKITSNGRSRVTVDLIRRSWVRFPPRSKDFFFTSYGSLIPFTRVNAQWLCTTRSHGTKLHILVSKLHSGTSKTMHLPLFWKSHCATCSPVDIILYHVTGSCKGPISTLIYISELILCFTICVLSATRHNIHMYLYKRRIPLPMFKVFYGLQPQ